MKSNACIFAVVAFTLSAAFAHGQGANAPLPGWMGVFPEYFNYSRKFEKPKVVDKKSYGQAASYDWLGGRAETFTVTLLRDAGEAKKALQRAAEAKKTLKIGKYEALDGGPTLVILLGEDRLVALESSRFNSQPSDLVRFAKMLNLDACAKALADAPRTDGRTIERFQSLKKGMSLMEVDGWVGHAEKDIGSGIHIMSYKLDDGSRVLIGFPDFKALIYVKHRDKADKVVDLVK